jgi:hypothetical protein
MSEVDTTIYYKQVIHKLAIKLVTLKVEQRRDF